MLNSILIIALSSLLWRIRGGLWKEYIPANKIWYAVAFAVYGCFYFSFGFENALVGFIACYASYQLYGWGLYLGSLYSGTLDINERECELIDDILFNAKLTIKGNEYRLTDYPRLFGFCGTCLTGLIITFLWGLFTADLAIMVSGLAMGLVYWLGYYAEKLYAMGKNGWNWGEIFFGMYLGVILAWRLLW